MHMNEKETHTNQKTVKHNAPTSFRPLPEILDYEPQFIEPVTNKTVLGETLYCL